MISFCVGFLAGACLVFIYHSLIIAKKNEVIAQINSGIDKTKADIKTDLNNVSNHL